MTTTQPQSENGGACVAVSLPMYDWPEIREATDSLWRAVRHHLAERNIDAPEGLDRKTDLETLWNRPDLLLTQTCGYPYANTLAGKVALVATPAHAITGARPGNYFSVLIARKAGAPDHIEDLAEKRFAYNMQHSQSGFAAPARLLAAAGATSLPAPLQTGAHRASIRAVASAQADWAAIDAVTWELARRHEPSTRDLTVFATTPQTPALPLITGARNAERAGAIADAFEAAIAGLDDDDRQALLITSLARSKPGDYAPLASPLPVDKAFPGLAGR